MTQKLKKAHVFACKCVISSHRIKCNTWFESSYEGRHFFFLQWWAMSNIWGHYGLKALKFGDLTVLCAVSFAYLLEETYLWNHELTNICWPSRLRLRSNWNLFTVACNCSFLVDLISDIRNIMNPRDVVLVLFSSFYRSQGFSGVLWQAIRLRVPVSTCHIPRDSKMRNIHFTRFHFLIFLLAWRISTTAHLSSEPKSTNAYSDWVNDLYIVKEEPRN